MIEVLPNVPDGVVGFRCADHVTRQDYEAVLIPTLNAAFNEHKKLRAYSEILTLRTPPTGRRVLGSFPQPTPRVPEGAARTTGCSWPRSHRGRA